MNWGNQPKVLGVAVACVIKALGSLPLRVRLGLQKKKKKQLR